MTIHAIAGAAAGPFAAASALLACAGIAKIRRPGATQPAVATLGLPASPAIVRALGVVEVTAAGAGLVFGGVAALVVAVMYAALAIAATRLLLRSPGTPCGCLGASDAPVSTTHIVVNGAAVIAATLAIAGGSPLRAAGSGSWTRVAFVLFVACGAWLGALILDALPTLDAALHESGSR